MSLQVRKLAKDDARAIFKNIHFDFRRFKKLSMFIHAESSNPIRPVQHNDLTAVIRIGADF